MKQKLSKSSKLLNDRQIVAKATGAARKAVLWTARDVRSAARRSIKSGGKNPVSTAYKSSKPGEPPRSHKGTLKNAIVYEKLNDDAYIIGAPRLGSSTALKLLEFGGQARSNKVYYQDEYVERMGRKRSGRSKKGGGVVKPTAARPYVVASRSTRKVVKDYRRFNSRDAWERARKSAAFLAWAQSVRLIENAQYTLKPRPYMYPALLLAGSPEKVAERLKRAAGLN